MYDTTRPSLRALVAACLSGVAFGCTPSDETSTATRAISHTPQVFPSRSHHLIEQAGAITPAQPESGAAIPQANGPAYDPVYINVNAEPDQGGAPLTVQFTAEVEGGPPGLRYRWDFGDRSPPTGRRTVEHTYREPGDYTAVFTVSGPDIEETEEVSIEVSEEGFDVSIEADPDIGRAPLVVQLQAVLDEELPGPFYYQWDLGDGGRDVRNPTTHTYRTPGEYTAVLVVTNAQGQMGRADVQIQVDPASGADDAE
jgi:PKD repeat protein